LLWEASEHIARVSAIGPIAIWSPLLVKVPLPWLQSAPAASVPSDLNVIVYLAGRIAAAVAGVALPFASFQVQTSSTSAGYSVIEAPSAAVRISLSPCQETVCSPESICANWLPTEPSGQPTKVVISGEMVNLSPVSV
jgi:hypothetical protein